MVGRIFTSGNDYRYSINGQEKTPEIAPNTTTALFWEYDARISRRWNVDPVLKVGESSYLAFSGNPIWFTDRDGDDTLVIHRSEIIPELSNSRTAIYLITFSIIENGIQRQLETMSGKVMYMISNVESDKRDDNDLSKDYYKLRFDKMSAYPNRKNDIRVTDDGVFLHPGKDAGWVDGCKIITSELEVAEDGTILPKTTFTNSEKALQEIKDLYNSVKPKLTGDKFLLKTKSKADDPPEVIDDMPLEIENTPL